MTKSFKMGLRHIFRETLFFYNRRRELKLKVFRRAFFLILGINYRASVNLTDLEMKIHGPKVTKIDTKSPALLYQGINGLNHFFDERLVIRVANPVINMTNGSVFIRDSNTGELNLIEQSISGLPMRRLIEEESRYNRVHKFDSGNIRLGILSRNYFHAVIEEVPKLLKSNQDTPVLIGSSGTWLGKEVYGNSKLIVAPTNKLLQVDQLELTTTGFDTGFLHPDDYEALKRFQAQVCTAVQDNLPKKVYVSRINSRRSPVNEDQVASIFQKYGFTVIEPSSKSLVEQMSYFSLATHIAGISGAGLVNALWGTNAKLLEIMPLNRINRCFEFMCSISRQNYESYFFQSDKIPVELEELEMRIRDFI